VRVQGEGAAREIATALEHVNALREPVDVVVVARGGGNLEDLWSFNEELVVRAICASRIPVISAVGHEIDVTLADLAADVRALTPSEAAERVAPALDELVALLGREQHRLGAGLRARAAAARSRVDALAACRVFRRPLERLQVYARHIDDLEMRATRGLLGLVERARRATDAKARHLESLSPLGVLGRGYSLTRRARDGSLAMDASLLEPGEQLVTRLASGEVVSRVESIEDSSDSQ